jgi:hypothetical protein
MNTKALLSFALLLSLAPAAWQSAAAGCAMELEIVGSSKTSDKIRTYDENGKRGEEVDKSLALKQQVIDCNESLGLVKVVLTNGKETWLNRSEAKRIAGVAQNTSVCVTEPSTRDPDHVVAGTSGAEPTQQAHCNSPTK